MSAQERLDHYVRTHSMRPSAVRNEVLLQACNLHQPFTADQLIAVCATERISVGTVYNCLQLFSKAHIIMGKQRQRGHIATEYEVLHDTSKHMQFICLKCGRTIDFNDKAIARLIEERKYSNFNLQQYSLIVYGECKICRGKGKVE
jgi:Fe2+ or Zn2+ uptake regulation protein